MNTPKMPMSFSRLLPSNSPDENEQEQLKSTLSELDIGMQDEWPERYEMAVFLLTQFNVHYMSWIKNTDHLGDYMERFSCLFDRVIQLPEFSGQVDGQLKHWLIEQSTTNCLQYRRQLLLTLNSLTGPKTAKKMRIALLQKDNDNLVNSANTTVDDSAGLMSEDESDEGNDEEEDLLDEKVLSELMTDDECCSPHGQQCGGSIGGETSPFISQNGLEVYSTDKPEKEDHLSKGSIKQANLATETFSKDATSCTLLGEVDLNVGVAYMVTLPKETNAIGKHVYLKLALIDAIGNDAREYIAIHISEAMVSGFSGFTKRFNISLNGSGPEELMDLIEFELSLKWQTDTTSFAELVPLPSAFLRKLPGAMFLLGDYYWHFYRSFYRWTALQCSDSYVRYLAIQSFHELALMLSPSILYDDMARIFVFMYPPGGYLLPDQLPMLDDTKQEYLCEPLSRLDNAIFVFSFLFKEEQIDVIRHLVPFVGTLIQFRLNFTKRLVLQVRQYLSNYAVEDTEAIVLPFATNLLNALIKVKEPGEELHDPRNGIVDWEIVNSVARNVATLIVECIQCSRPVEWAQLSVEHSKMATTSRILEHTIGALFTENGIEFLKAIYMRLRSKKILFDQHLAPFLTSHRIEQYRHWFP